MSLEEQPCSICYEPGVIPPECKTKHQLDTYMCSECQQKCERCPFCKKPYERSDTDGGWYDSFDWNPPGIRRTNVGYV